jgi:error-prone DNA polymerase
VPEDGRSLRAIGHAGHGAARPQRRLRRAALSHGGEKGRMRAHIGSEITCTNGHSLSAAVRNREGYQNLCRLVTRMKLRAKKGEGAATLDEIAEFARGLICITPPSRGAPARYLRPRHLYAELQRHMDRGKRKPATRPSSKSARRLGIPLVATNGVCYATPGSASAGRASPACAQNVTLKTAGRLLERNAERHVKTPARNGAPVRRPAGSHRQHREISSRLEFTLADLGYEFPRYPVPGGRDHGRSCASAWMKARAAATSRITSARGGRSSASWR